MNADWAPDPTSHRVEVLALDYLSAAQVDHARYDSASFTAGLQVGIVATKLMDRPAELTAMVHDDLHAQMGELARRFGYQITWSTTAMSTWSHVIFTRYDRA